MLAEPRQLSRKTLSFLMSATLTFVPGGLSDLRLTTYGALREIIGYDPHVGVEHSESRLQSTVLRLDLSNRYSFYFLADSTSPLLRSSLESNKSE